MRIFAFCFTIVIGAFEFCSAGEGFLGDITVRKPIPVCVIEREIPSLWDRMYGDSYMSPIKTSCEDVFRYNLFGNPKGWTIGPMLRSEYPSPFRFGPLDMKTIGVEVGVNF